ncbi:MAG: adenine phosphoribosyltransferase [Lachnospiraceae bacterium]|nr:adenine phosphoribosyltransferase [Lachnospiraceae bacterium]
MKKVEDYVRTIPDFPEKGIMFRDITTVVADPDGLRLAVDEMTALLSDVEYDAIVGLESRGFIFGMPIAYKEHKPFILIRKKGKLPRQTVSMKYELEYGEAEIEIHKEDLKPGERVVLVDDLLATGGTMDAAVKLVEMLGCKVVKAIFLLELKGLNGREKLSRIDVGTVVSYDGK